MIGIRTVIDLQTCVAVVVCGIIIVGVRVGVCGSWGLDGRDLRFLLSDRVMWIVQAVGEKSSAVSATDQDTKVLSSHHSCVGGVPGWGGAWCFGVRSTRDDLVC